MLVIGDLDVRLSDWMCLENPWKCLNQ